MSHDNDLSNYSGKPPPPDKDLQIHPIIIVIFIIILIVGVPFYAYFS
ncbi:MAG: hypothetical protein ACI9TY_001778 [Alphaproteobacteria bacterium]|jgi:hypothetical protein